MREILFRAKAINRVKGNFYRTKYKNGDWVYGLVSKLNKEYDIGSLPMEMTNTDGVSEIEVDYNTLGQFTGLTDKNGKKIFEGDILQFCQNPNYKKQVGFGEGAFGLCYNNGECVSAFSDSEYYEDTKEYEVIGNIHDNPELLGE